MKLKLIKDSMFNKIGFVTEEIDLDRDKIVITPEQAIEYGIAEVVEEKKKPKFKVGDCVVAGKRFKKIGEVNVYGENFLYDGYVEKSLRTPTKEELELYFR